MPEDHAVRPVALGCAALLLALLDVVLAIVCLTAGPTTIDPVPSVMGVCLVAMAVLGCVAGLLSLGGRRRRRRSKLVGPAALVAVCALVVWLVGSALILALGPTEDAANFIWGFFFMIESVWLVLLCLATLLSFRAARWGSVGGPEAVDFAGGSSGSVATGSTSGSDGSAPEPPTTDGNGSDPPEGSGYDK